MDKLSSFQTGLLRATASVMSSRRSPALLVLIYHRVFPVVDSLLPDEPTVESFAAQMDLVGGVFNVLGLTEATARLRSNSLPARAACITFDDGYANNYDSALPILAARGLPATFFIATGFIGNGRMWNDTVIESIRLANATLDLSALGLGTFEFPDAAARRRAIDQLLGILKYLAPAERAQKVAAIAELVGRELPKQLMMTAAQIRSAAERGMEIGAHTVTHPILKSLEPQVARQEIADSKHALEEITGKTVTSFAYPNGRPNQDYAREHVAIVRDLGFDAAVSTAWGSARVGDDSWQVPRIAPWDRTAFRYGVRMISSYVGAKAVSV